VPCVSLGAALIALTLGTGGLFKTWAFDVLAHQPFEWWKATDLYDGYFLLFVPSLVTVLVDQVALARDASDGAAAARRVATLPAAYAPFALAALFKSMGGPNNLALLGFLLVVCALPAWLVSLSSGSSSSRASRLRAIAAFGVAALQIGVLYPRRRVQSQSDADNARLICDYVARRMACGERVHLGRGSVCYARGGVRVPVDRLNSIVDASVGGRRAELGFYGRVTAEEYDVLVLPIRDLVWLGGDFWTSFQGHYRAFFSTRGELDNDYWFDGWQGYVSWPMIFFERQRDKGRHVPPPEAEGTPGCGP
jgi:hypothetical protein